MHVIYLPFLHFLWCALFSWFIGNLIIFHLFFNCILSIGVSIFLINMHCVRYIIWKPHPILVSWPPILCFNLGYYYIIFLCGVCHPISKWCLISYLICHCILSQLNRACLLYILNVYPYCCLILLFNLYLPASGCLLGDIGFLLCEAILLCDCATISSVVYNITHDQILVSFTI